MTLIQYGLAGHGNVTTQVQTDCQRPQNENIKIIHRIDHCHLVSWSSHFTPIKEKRHEQAIQFTERSGSFEFGILRRLRTAINSIPSAHVMSTLPRSRRSRFSIHIDSFALYPHRSPQPEHIHLHFPSANQNTVSSNPFSPCGFEIAAFSLALSFFMCSTSTQPSRPAGRPSSLSGGRESIIGRGRELMLTRLVSWVFRGWIDVSAHLISTDNGTIRL